ncbi:MAG: type II 3-dehydroquinate dehydratase [Candidatus Omnitrophota bacterium]
MKKILIIHGPNLNLLGKREKDIYGNMSLDKINELLESEAKVLRFSLEIFQSNHEGEIVQKLQDAPKSNFKAIIINAAAYTHTSIAIRDAVSAIEVPVIEVHISNIYAREEFRHTSLIAPVAAGQISGFGHDSYILALRGAAGIIK